MRDSIINVNSHTLNIDFKSNPPRNSDIHQITIYHLPQVKKLILRFGNDTSRHDILTQFINLNPRAIYQLNSIKLNKLPRPSIEITDPDTAKSMIAFLNSKKQEKANDIPDSFKEVQNYLPVPNTSAEYKPQTEGTTELYISLLDLLRQLDVNTEITAQVIWISLCRLTKWTEEDQKILLNLIAKLTASEQQQFLAVKTTAIPLQSEVELKIATIMNERQRFSPAASASKIGNFLAAYPVSSSIKPQQEPKANNIVVENKHEEKRNEAQEVKESHLIDLANQINPANPINPQVFLHLSKQFDVFEKLPARIIEQFLKLHNMLSRDEQEFVGNEMRGRWDPKAHITVRLALAGRRYSSAQQPSTLATFLQDYTLQGVFKIHAPKVAERPLDANFINILLLGLKVHISVLDQSSEDFLLSLCNELTRSELTNFKSKMSILGFDFSSQFQDKLKTTTGTTSLTGKLIKNIKITPSAFTLDFVEADRARAAQALAMSSEQVRAPILPSPPEQLIPSTPVGSTPSLPPAAMARQMMQEISQGIGNSQQYLDTLMQNKADPDLVAELLKLIEEQNKNPGQVTATTSQSAHVTQLPFQFLQPTDPAFQQLKQAYLQGVQQEQERLMSSHGSRLSSADQIALAAMVTALINPPSQPAPSAQPVRIQNIPAASPSSSSFSPPSVSTVLNLRPADAVPATRSHNTNRQPTSESSSSSSTSLSPPSVSTVPNLRPADAVPAARSHNTNRQPTSQSSSISSTSFSPPGVTTNPRPTDAVLASRPSNTVRQTSSPASANASTINSGQDFTADDAYFEKLNLEQKKLYLSNLVNTAEFNPRNNLLAERYFPLLEINSSATATATQTKLPGVSNTVTVPQKATPSPQTQSASASTPASKKPAAAAKTPEMKTAESSTPSKTPSKAKVAQSPQGNNEDAETQHHDAEFEKLPTDEARNKYIGYLRDIADKPVLVLRYMQKMQERTSPAKNASPQTAASPVAVPPPADEKHIENPSTGKEPASAVSTNDYEATDRNFKNLDLAKKRQFVGFLMRNDDGESAVALIRYQAMLDEAEAQAGIVMPTAAILENKEEESEYSQYEDLFNSYKTDEEKQDFVKTLKELGHDKISKRLAAKLATQPGVIAVTTNQIIKLENKDILNVGGLATKVGSLSTSPQPSTKTKVIADLLSADFLSKVEWVASNTSSASSTASAASSGLSDAVTADKSGNATSSSNSAVSNTAASNSAASAITITVESTTVTAAAGTAVISNSSINNSSSHEGISSAETNSSSSTNATVSASSVAINSSSSTTVSPAAKESPKKIKADLFDDLPAKSDEISTELQLAPAASNSTKPTPPKKSLAELLAGTSALFQSTTATSASSSSTPTTSPVKSEAVSLVDVLSNSKKQSEATTSADSQPVVSDADSRPAPNDGLRSRRGFSPLSP